MAAETDTLPLLPPPATDDGFEFYAPPAHKPVRLHSAPIFPQTTTSTATTSSSTRGSPINPFRPPQSTLTQQTLPRRSTDTDNTSLLPAYTPARYRGHASEEEYLAALRAWAEEKLYMQPGEKGTLVGFYGKETMKERIEKAPPPLKLRVGRKKREGKGEGEQGKMGEEGDGEVVGERGSAEGEGERRGRRKSSIGNWLGRKRAS